MAGRVRWLFTRFLARLFLSAGKIILSLISDNNYDCVQNVVSSQNYVAEYALDNYPITEDDILAKGQDAWDSVLNTVNIGKYNLGWASIGICTHAFYEAINHAGSRQLYKLEIDL